jgi:hypothetical protein
MRAYVQRHRQRVFAAEARRQSQVIAARADPLSDEAEVMRWIDDISSSDSWTA